MKKTLCLLLVLVMMLTAFVACSSKAEETPAADAPAADTPADDAPADDAPAEEAFNPADYPIGYCGVLRTHPVIQMMLGGLKDACDEMGYPLYLYVPDEYDTSKAYALAEAGVTQHGIKGMVQYIFDDSTPMYIEKWESMGIAVTSAHTYLSEDVKADYPGLRAWAECSAEEYGAEAAKAIGEKIGGKGVVAVTEGSFNVTEDAAAAAFIAEMKASYPDVVCLDPQEEGFDTPTAIQKATAIVQANPELVGAFSTTGSGCSTWAGAIDNTGRELAVISMDYTETNLDLVKEGKIYGIVAQPLYDGFYEAVALLDKHFRGEEIEWANVVEAPIVTAETVDDYYDLIAHVNEIMAEVN